MHIYLTEHAVNNYPDPDMEGWRLFRIDYGGTNEDSIMEAGIWLPPDANPEELEKLFEKWQGG